MNDEQKAAANTDAKSYEGFSDEERAAMKDRAQELKAESRRRSGRKSAKDKEAEAEAAVLDKIAEMPEPDRVLAERIHAIVQANAPELTPKLWYGMPAYAKDGKLICFFTSADKFKSRYATFGFETAANLDDGTMWPTSFALTGLNAATEKRISELVKKAVG